MPAVDAVTIKRARYETVFVKGSTVLLENNAYPTYKLQKSSQTEPPSNPTETPHTIPSTKKA
jgi:hypothetical protein